MNFEEARAEYQRLRQAYEGRALAPDEYARRVQALQVRDANGAYWAIDGASGGWLRYDGADWVSDQPPLDQPLPAWSPSPQAQPGGGALPTDATQVVGSSEGAGYTPPGQSPVGYAPAAQVAPPPAAPSGSRNKALIAGCLAVTAVLLLGCVGLGAFAVASGVFDRTTGITRAVTASSVTGDNEPETTATEFSPNSTIYITYTAKNVKQGQKVEIKLFRNGTELNLPSRDRQTIFSNDRRTVNGLFQFTTAQRGEYRAELTLDDAPSPDETVTFTVR